MYKMRNFYVFSFMMYLSQPLRTSDEGKKKWEKKKKGKEKKRKVKGVLKKDRKKTKEERKKTIYTGVCT